MEFNLKLYFSDKSLEKKEDIVESIVKDLKHKDSDIHEVYSYYLPFFFNSDSPFSKIAITSQLEFSFNNLTIKIACSLKGCKTKYFLRIESSSTCTFCSIKNKKI